MKAEKYLESIGLDNAIGEEFMNDDDKSYYTVEELMESYHQSELDLLTVPVVIEPFYCFSEEADCGRCNKVCDDCKKVS